VVQIYTIFGNIMAEIPEFYRDLNKERGEDEMIYLSLNINGLRKDL